ncbi:hypothetical protein [Pseudonocardia sp.]|uniref:hypothetical protein n=1 Tax=Pseudonocardia sp. TaxID=60912 RepID=UPI003D0B7D97
MATSTRLAATPIVAFAIAFVVMLALGQLIPSSSESSPRPADSPPPNLAEPWLAEPAPAPPTAPPPEAEDKVVPSPAPAKPGETRETTIGPLVAGTPPRESELRPQVWPGDAPDQVHVCVQVPTEWQIKDQDWRPAGGRVYCRDAASGESLTLTLVAA